jgi:hypothetical protein
MDTNKHLPFHDFDMLEEGAMFPEMDIAFPDDRDDDVDTEPRESFDLSDDGDALASAGMGTDEDYGGGCEPDYGDPGSDFGDD